jgi:CubicO group peptidase (beta-lactamase class C family)
MRLFDDRPESFRPIMDGQGFGLDFAVVNETSKAGYAVPKGSYYWGGAAGTWFWIDPQNDLFFIGMIQIFGSNGIDWDMRREASQLVYAALEK